MQDQRPAPLAVLTPLLLTGLLAPAAATQDTGPRLELESLDGTVSHRPIGSTRLTDPRQEGAWMVRPLGLDPPKATRDHRPEVEVLLVGGDALLGRVLGGEEEVLEVELLGGVRLPVPVDRIERLIFPENQGGGEPAALSAPPEGDRLYRRTPRALDAVEGTLVAFTSEGIRFESFEVGEQVFAYDEVAALFVELFEEDEPSSAAKEGRVPVVCDLGDASRIRGSLRAISSAGCELQVGGFDLTLPLEAVVEIVVADGKLAFLSDLAPVREEGNGTPFDDGLGKTWPHRIDRNVEGRALTGGGRTWRRGIGMHAPSKLVFDLAGKYARLRGSCAIDDSVLRLPAQARGSVVFRVHADGEVLWESALVRGGDPVVPLPAIDVTGRRELVLEADPSGHFAGDRANWLRLTLQ